MPTIECAHCSAPIFLDRCVVATDPWGSNPSHYCTEDCMCNAGEEAEEAARERYYGGDCPTEVYERNANR